ncbi:hypothetical protein AVEN_92252-1 [Araneus ventricosus]|uniref:Uncharacterized protein n=1 Tax=Araneus ventricosus TaxID=182803 RepID=A0A4Y2AKF5_ARAVE|nr:hypothetical protein AVEN_92252-1 [Araneus ventricosus]
MRQQVHSKNVLFLPTLFRIEGAQQQVQVASRGPCGCLSLILKVLGWKTSDWRVKLGRRSRPDYPYSTSINQLCKRNPLLPEISFQDFLNMDSDVICTEEISDEQIIADIMNEKENLSDFEQEENEITQRPTAKQAAEWLSGLRHIFEGNNNCEMISSIDKMETCIFQNVILKQKKISAIPIFLSMFSSMYFHLSNTVYVFICSFFKAQ